MRFELPDNKALVHTMTIPIRWGDMDAMAHMNNTIYFRFFEIVRLDWLARHNACANPNGEGPVIVNAFCNFLKQLEFPGTVVAKHYVANPGRTSIETYFELERDDEPGVVYSNGGGKMVWVDSVKKQSVALPAWLRDAAGVR